MANYKYRRNDYNKRNFFALIIIGILIGIIVSQYYFLNYEQEKEYVYITSNHSFSSAEIGLAAIDQDGNGVITPLIVEVKPGNGKTLTNIEKLLFWVDTQQSIQTSKEVASEYADINVDDIDLTYTVESEATLVGGPSAGASLTAATIAALENRKIKNDILMTGTIEPDGRIGQVGGVLEKAKVAKEVGAKVFLVPEGQSTQTYYGPEESCVRRSNMLFCTTKYKEITVNIGEEANISVIEVANIEEAMKFLLL